MKTLATLALLLSLSFAGAQTPEPPSTTTTTTTTTSPAPNEISGIIVSYNATTCALIVQIPDVTAPANFITNTATVLVDYANNPITVAFLQSGLPITVYFDPAIPNVATKVILRKVTKATK